MPKYVVSSTLRDPELSNSTVIDGDIGEAVRGLRDRGRHPGQRSVRLASALSEQGLIDELRLMLFPTVLGAGKRLFGETGSPLDVELPSRGRRGRR